jgi:hypothetical protein
MPASEAQIRANQANSKRSTGPSTPQGKSRSRTNATKHGLAGVLADVEAEFSPEFNERRVRWAAEQQPAGENGNWAMDRVVAASFRIERCERAMDGLVMDVQQRARLTWDQDRAVEAATIAGRLTRDPVLASRQLQSTLAGVVLLVEAWLGLAAIVGDGTDWSESEASKALDLLGVPPDIRSGLTPINAPDGSDAVAFRLRLALEEVERLEALRDEAMIPLDELERRQAMKGDVALLSKRAQLLMRYERDAWKRYHDSMKELKTQPTPDARPVVAAKSPVVAERPTIERLTGANDRIAAKPATESELPGKPGLQADARNPPPGSFVPIAAGSPNRPATERTQSGGRAMVGTGHGTGSY